MISPSGVHPVAQCRLLVGLLQHLINRHSACGDDAAVTQGRGTEFDNCIGHCGSDQISCAHDPAPREP